MYVTNPAKDFRYNGTTFQQASTVEMVFREGIPEVVSLYREFTEPGAKVNNWQFKRKVINLAMRLFNNGGTNWFLRADEDSSIQEYNYEFILDTVRYIATGRRRISMHAWPSLMSAHDPNAIRKEHMAIRKLFSELALNVSTTELIQRWCSHKDGVYDLMFTLNLMFGDRKTEANQ